MLVGRLFEALFKAGVVIVATSNRPPTELYKDGLNRHLFLPFIDLIETHLELYPLDVEKDYRQLSLSQDNNYLFPLDDVSKAHFNTLWGKLVSDKAEPLCVKVKGRDVILPYYHSGVGRSHFDDLCRKPFGAADYLALMAHIRVLFIEDVPYLSRSDASAAKRFVTLIDTAYEAKVRLVIRAESTVSALYKEGVGAFEFERTKSRIVEMTSPEWGT